MIEISIHKKLVSTEGDMLLQIDEEIQHGSFVTLYGKSGAGKTTSLRIISGLLDPDRGRISVNGEIWLDKDAGINLKPQKRKVGFLFQDYALFPNMSVFENLQFALSTNQSESIISQLIEIMELGDLKGRKPETLSGGQKQRVALARSLVQKPELLLLDEPLSALDVEMRSKLQPYILQVHREYNLTTILISHDTSEILKLSDQMLVIDHGRITKKGSPVEVFTQKEVSGKFQFVGEVVRIDKQDFIFIVTILIANELVKVVANENEAEGLIPGDKVLVASKAFNPRIKRIE
jgi:molybdate transport system ATP-binding protein